MNGIKKIASLCETTGVKTASMYNSPPQRFLVGYNIDYIVKIESMIQLHDMDNTIRIHYLYGNEVKIDKFYEKISPNTFSDLREFLALNETKSLNNIINEIKQKMNE